MEKKSSRLTNPYRATMPKFGHPQKSDTPPTSNYFLNMGAATNVIIYIQQQTDIIIPLVNALNRFSIS